MKAFRTIIISAILMALAASPAYSQNIMVPKGDFSLGAQFAHFKLNSDNSELMLLINPVSAQGRISQIAPFFEYAYKDDCSFGGRLNYIAGDAILDSITLDLLSEGLSFDISDLNTHMRSFGASIFHRNYFALDSRSRIAVIAEESLSYVNGRTDYDYASPGQNYSASRKLNFAFSPGIIFYVMNDVSAFVTVSMANVSYNTVRCYTGGTQSGDRTKFAARFGVDLTGIGFGVAFHF